MGKTPQESKYMRMLRTRMFSAVCLIMCISCASANAQSYEINGTWFVEKVANTNDIPKKEFGWGVGLSVPNSYYEIDTVNKKIYVPGLFLMDIVSVTFIEPDTSVITAFFRQGNFNVTFKIHFITPDSIWIEYDGPGQLGGNVGGNVTYYRISGPHK